MTKEHTWPQRLPSERRIHPRVRVGFPVNLVRSGSDGALAGVVTDVGIGGLRVQVARFVEPSSELTVNFEVAVTNRDGYQAVHPLQAVATVTRTHPEAPVKKLAGADPSEYELSLQFTEVDHERERLLGVFMLQTLLFVPGAELT